jgi:drug/metabolite transporter (DMT)-like permease
MDAVLLGLVASVTNAVQAVINKGLTDRFPARQLIGVLYLLNCAVLLPFAPWVAPWHLDAEVLLLHAISVALMAVTALCVWDLFDKGAASATTTATALSPIPAASATALLLPGSLHPVQVVAAVVVVGGVLWALQGAFVDIGRRGTVGRVLGAAIGTGLLTVASRLLADRGVGVVETYVVRTGICAGLFIALIPPRNVPLSAAPRLVVRSLLVTISFVAIILGVAAGSPVVVQTLVATTPLFALAIESWQTRVAPHGRAMAAAGLVTGGVAVMLVG